jgi:hypothetical protein
MREIDGEVTGFVHVKSCHELVKDIYLDKLGHNTEEWSADMGLE